MRVLLATASVLPNYGGPAFSVSRLAKALAEAGIKVGLWAANQSAATSPLTESARGITLLNGSATQVLNCFGKPDVLHDNGIWLPHNHRIASLAARLGIPRVVSPRGALEPWALAHKAWKKRAAWWLYQRADLKRAHLLHATAEPEARSITSLNLGAAVRVIPNGIDVPAAATEGVSWSGDNLYTALFLGRLYPVKGLPMLIEAWSRLRPQNWRLQIAGPDEAGHRGELERLVTSTGLNETVTFLGPLGGDAKTTALRRADLFVLPTYSENFGMAIGEALAHGLPVLTTTGAPWPMLPARGCGWWVEPSVEGLMKGLREAAALDRSALRVMGTKGRDWVAAEFGWDGVARQFLSAYETLIAGRDAGSGAFPSVAEVSR
ncbi:MAG: glycosyltransferase [Hyphomicrobiaceae bacterium]|nr:glycosyltransferase [Hyphomicrobiaceae bacterium]